MLQIGAFRAWMKKQIEDKKITFEQYIKLSNREAQDHQIRINAYRQAMKDVAQYMDFPLDEEAWKRW